MYGLGFVVSFFSLFLFFPWLLVTGYWSLVSGVRFLVYSFWFLVSGFCFSGMWYQVYGLWFTVHGLWFMVHDLWLMAYLGAQRLSRLVELIDQRHQRRPLPLFTIRG